MKESRNFTSRCMTDDVRRNQDALGGITIDYWNISKVGDYVERKLTGRLTVTNVSFEGVVRVNVVIKFPRDILDSEIGSVMRKETS